MERSCRVQAGTTLSQALPCLFGSLDSGNISRYHYLTRRIEIGAYQYFVLSAFIADTLGVFMGCIRIWQDNLLAQKRRT